MATTDKTQPLADLTGFQRDLLAAVGANPGAKGLRLKEWMETAYGGQEVLHGKLYPNLDTLTELGLVEKAEADGRTNSYRLTVRGERDLRDHAQWLFTGVSE